MKRMQKNAWMYYIISNDRQCRFDTDKEFYELDWYQVEKLEKYAELFNIKQREYISKAATLWARIHDDLPF